MLKMVSFNFAFAVAAASLTACTPGTTQVEPIEMRVNATLVDEAPEAMFASASVVVRARVKEAKGTFVVDAPSGDDRKPGSTLPWVYSEWTVLPTKIYKNNGAVKVGRTITVALRGGEAAGVKMQYASEAELKPGEEVILFLTSQDGIRTAAPGRYFVYAMDMGKYTINASNAMAETRDARRAMKVTELEARLR